MKRSNHLSVVLLLRVLASLLILLHPLAAGTAKAQTLEVSGEVKTPLTLKAADLQAMPHGKVTAKEKDGSESEYDGIPLHAILAKAGVPSGEQLRGNEMLLYVLIEAADGYAVVLSLPEIDPLFTDDPVFLADARGGQPLDAQHGPLQLVLPRERRHARWVRQVTRIQILKAPAAGKAADAAGYLPK